LARANKQVTILRRHKAIKEIKEELSDTRQAITTGAILDRLSKRGIKIDRSTCNRDQLKINETNQFLLELAGQNFSSYVENMWNNLNYIEEQSYELAAKDWVVKRNVTKKSKNGISVESSTESNQYAPKVAFLNLAVRVIAAKDNMLKGEHIDLAHGLIKEKFNQLREENQAYHSELQYKNKKIIELKKIIDGHD